MGDSKFGLRRWTFFPATRMEAKLFIVFVLLIIIPVGGLTYISSLRYTNTIEKNTVTYAAEISDKMVSKLDDYTKDMKKISIIPSYLGEIQEGLKLSNHYYSQVEAETGGNPNLHDGKNIQMKLQIQRKIESSIYFMNNIKEGASSVYLFDAYGNPYYVMKSGGARANLPEFYNRWHETAAAANGKPVLISTQEVSGDTNRKRYVFTIVRNIIDSTYHSVGIIAVDASIEVIENVVNDLDETTKGTTLILDEAGTVIYDSEQAFLAENLSGDALLQQAEGQNGSYIVDKNGKEQLVIYRKSEESGWLTLILIPKEQVEAEAIQTRNYTAAAAIAIMTLALLISIVLIFALTKPMREMVKLMKQVQAGNLDVAFPVRRRDEVGMLGNAFNRMMVRIQLLIENIYRMEQRKNQIELESLQRQINPHFIYNTLESIRMTAVLNDDPEAAEMVQLLGQQLRYSIHAGDETVTASQEFEHLRMYMRLINDRFGDRFQLELPEGEAAWGIRVMKLLFQPIVENAVNHAYEDSRETMLIRIDWGIVGREQWFTVADDGCGMEEAQLLRVRNALSAAEPLEPNGRGIGLRNVHERLKLRFGVSYGLTIDSEQGKGTRVTIRMPLEQE
ncbi:sensor histidine kinase [Paenibacillus sp. Leaf72]|uniref:sensor histidine kinase n=1 Tax=Paenibacillus sp. Leaf72 TaxID=1736234 RepID=UPI0006F95C8C|nr:sensor histidine kinase [Paenibacillus sp. Leaf72]KQN99970.1 histidine kinase [Paenibacillus sp. Leaf72]